jgi:hypothetical protein
VEYCTVAFASVCIEGGISGIDYTKTAAEIEIRQSSRQRTFGSEFTAELREQEECRRAEVAASKSFAQRGAGPST